MIFTLESVKYTIKALKSRDFDEENLVHWKEISVCWMLDVFAKAKFIQRLKDFDCPLWFVRKVCIIELLHGKKFDVI